MNKLDLQNASIIKPKSINYEIIGGRKNVIRKEKEIYKTPSRAQIGYQTSILPSLDDLPMIDRSDRSIIGRSSKLGSIDVW